VKHLSLVFALCVYLFALDPKAREIMTKADERDKGDRMTARMEMILIDKNKNRRVREIKQFRRYEGDDSYQLLFFIEPSDVRNTGFLTYDYDDSNKDDDQWLYLPTLKKSKRIASADKSGSFMGSDFSYSDMTDLVLSDYTFKLIGERNVGEYKTWVIECLPVSKEVVDETGYAKALLLIRQDNYMLIRAVFSEKKQGRIKMLDIPKLDLIDGVWQPLEMQMTSKEGDKTLHATILRFYDVKFNQDMQEDLFTIRRLESGL
jgi:outer membrane lipoprotein-sorting protein